MRIGLEVCVDTARGLLLARDCGADRVEICAALALGGLTPPTALMRLALHENIPNVIMIRPRAGDFVWHPTELDQIMQEIEYVQELGMGGIVIGANLPDGRLDNAALKRMLRDVEPGIEKVLHRCIDLTPDPVAAVETAIDLGFDRILTSGGALRAVDGIGTLKAMFDRARGRITIMPGAGITADNVGGLRAVLPLTQVHASCSSAIPQNPRAVAMGFTAAIRRETDAGGVAALRRVLDNPG